MSRRRIAVSSGRPLHPKHGPHDPASSTPLRRRDSVRRTTTHDSLRPDGLTGNVVVAARGRDLRTAHDGHATVLATAQLDTTIDYIPSRAIVTISTDPPHPGLDQLVGVRASSGFRQAVDAALPGERTSHSLRFQLLDDLPTAALVSGYALGADGMHPPRGSMSTLQHADLCAGWATGGTILLEMEEDGYPPVVTGPEAPDLHRSDDPLAWHDMDLVLPPHGMRRRRRLDVWAEAGRIAIECFFRDSHFDPDGLETVIHEYTVHAAVDPSTMRFTSSSADVGALPWMECPRAASSAERLVGAPADGLRSWVRDTFVGPPTCTHLNDTLRSLEDVPGLIAALPEPGEASS